MAKGKGGMGTSKHRKSGVVPKGRHCLRMVGMEVNKEEDKKKIIKEKKRNTTYGSIQELMKKERK